LLDTQSFLYYDNRRFYRRAFLMLRAVILTASKEEYESVRQHLINVKEKEPHKGTVYDQGRFSHWSVAIAEIGSNSAAQAERAISYFNPHVILFVGAAGGIKKKGANIGDVVASTRIYNSENTSVLPDFGLEQRARAESKKNNWLHREIKIQKKKSFIAQRGKYHGTVMWAFSRIKKSITPLSKHNVFVASIATRSFMQLEQYKDVVAIDIEGFDFLSATRCSHQVSAMVIRGISYLIDEEGAADTQSQLLATNNASAFAFEVLSKYSPPGTPRILEFNEKAKIFGIATSLSLLGLCLYKPLKTSGFMQSLDLILFDKAMQWRPDQGQDEKIVVVEIDSAGIGKNSQDRPYLPDKDLLDLTSKILDGKPNSVLLTMFRGAVTVDNDKIEREKLVDLINKNKNIVTVFGSLDSDGDALLPLKGINDREQIKVFDFLPDKEKENDQGVYRRGVTEFDSEDDSFKSIRDKYPTYRTEGTSSFYENAPYYVIRQFLKGIHQIDANDFTITQEKVNGVLKGYGGYQRSDEMTCEKGEICRYLERMTIINFRAGSNPFRVVKYNDNLTKEMLANSIVIVGYSEDTENIIPGNILNTSIGRMSRAMTAAHMMSEIKEHYLRSRPLIKAASDDCETKLFIVIVFGLTPLSGYLIKKIIIQSPLSIISIITIFLVISVSSFVAFGVMIYSLTQGVWIASIVSIISVFAFLIDGTLVSICVVSDYFRTRKNSM
jgi:CHASE2 domain-containing sensor protein/nucleoside phosphorylase